MARQARTAPIRRESLAEIVYDRLLEQILSGAHPAGAKLSELGLAKQFQVSRGPVREALRRLAADGLVNAVLNHKATVARFTARDLAEIYRVREILECGAAESAALNPDRSLLPAVREVFAAFKEEFAGEFNARRCLDLDWKFHAAIAQAAGNQYLLREIMRLARLIRVTQRPGTTRPSQKRSWEMHRKIFDAVERGDPKGARKAMSNHIASALSTLLTSLAAESAAGGDGKPGRGNGRSAADSKGRSAGGKGRSRPVTAATDGNGDGV